MLQRLFTLPQNRSHPIIYMTRKINYNKHQWRTWCTDDRNDIVTIMYVCDYFIIELFDVKVRMNLWFFSHVHSLSFVPAIFFSHDKKHMRIGSLLSHGDNQTKHRIPLSYIAQLMLLQWASITRACLQKMSPIWMRWLTSWICNSYTCAPIRYCVRNGLKLGLLITLLSAI